MLEPPRREAVLTSTYNLCFGANYAYAVGGSSLTNEKDHHYFLNRFVCVGEFFDG